MAEKLVAPLVIYDEKGVAQIIGQAEIVITKIDDSHKDAVLGGVWMLTPQKRPALAHKAKDGGK